MTRTQRLTAAFRLERLETMSAKTFIRLTIGLITLAGSLGAAGRWINSHPTRAEVDSAYVRRDTFALYRRDVVTVRLRDSLVLDARQARSDSMLSALVRACRRRGECP